MLTLKDNFSSIFNVLGEMPNKETLIKKIKGIISIYSCLFFCFNFSIFAQNQNPTSTNETFYIIGGIEIVGNKKTKAKTILREFDLAIGDTLWQANITETLEVNRNQIYNLGLFNEVTIRTENEAVDLDNEIQNSNIKYLIISVQERWYWMVFPVFELADRNFNVWWRDFNRDFRRTKYGFIAVKNNVGGRNETFVLNCKWGFNRKLIFSYEFPFIDKKKIWGLKFNTYYFADRELAYQSVNNEAIFYKHNAFANNRFGAGVGVTRRADIRNTHALTANYFNNSIVDTLALISPLYFDNNQLRQQYLKLQYEYEYDGRNIRAYPTKGLYFRGRISKTGIGIFNDINRFTLEANLSKYTELSETSLVGVNLKAHKSFGNSVPYNYNLKLGFLEHFVRGYEYYVIDAQQYLMLKTAFKKRVFDVDYKGMQKINEQLSSIPIQIYLKFFNEIAFTGDEYFADQNPLNNKLLAGFGFGLDVVTFYDNLFSFEYTINREKQHGFILHINTTWDFK